MDPLGLALNCKVVAKFGIFNIEKCEEDGKAPSEQDAKDAKRMSGSELEKASKRNGYADSHNLKSDLGLDSKSDIFCDKNGNMYSGARKGSRIPDWLKMNKYGR